jgi:hypothetical protein
MEKEKEESPKSMSPTPVKRRSSCFSNGSPKAKRPTGVSKPSLRLQLVVQNVLKLNRVVSAFRDALLRRRVRREWEVATPTCFYSFYGDTAFNFYKAHKEQMRSNNVKIVQGWREDYERNARLAKFVPFARK